MANDATPVEDATTDVATDATSDVAEETGTDAPEGLGTGGQNAIKAEREAAKQAKAEAKAAKEELAALKAQLDKLEKASQPADVQLREELDALKSELALERLSTARAKVAATHGLTEEQASFLAGNTADELEASAVKLTAAFAAEPRAYESNRPREVYKAGGANQSGPGTNYGDLAEQLRRR